MSGTQVMVEVLGTLRVHNLARPFRRTAARELVIYLALHPEGASPATCCDALWPAETVSRSTFYSAVSDARRALGGDDTGHSYLSRHQRFLRLSKHVTTDVDRFVELSTHSDPSSWVAAMELVRGPAFDGLSLREWTVLDGTQARVESLIASTALRACGHLLAAGQGAHSEWVLRQAMRVTPYDERLYRALLRSVAAQGNRSALRSRLVELACIARGGLADCSGDQLKPDFDALHSETIALYRELARGSGAAAGGEFARL